MVEMNLIMPMAGRGSRFAAKGIDAPKPLIDLFGRPFFWWAVESVRKTFILKDIVFVILDEHKAKFNIDKIILGYYPDAKIVSLPEVTSGAAETAWVGVNAINNDFPIAINDCDHAFMCDADGINIERFRGSDSGALMCFHSDSPAYSYVKISDNGDLIGTVEKVVVSNYAIAGCYLFSSPKIFLEMYQEYVSNCQYNELFVSGLYNQMASSGKKIHKIDLKSHATFGTPEELDAISKTDFDIYLKWISN